MRKLAVIVALSFVTGTSVMAAGTVRDNCGCGLGNMALGDLEPTVFVQFCATFLNALCGNQTFGITSGTLDCEPAPAFAQNKELQEFVSDNLDHLAMDMAAGSGDTLDAVADLLALSVDERPETFTKLQGGFDQIFTSESVSALDVLANMESVLQS